MKEPRRGNAEALAVMFRLAAVTFLTLECGGGFGHRVGHNNRGDDGADHDGRDGQGEGSALLGVGVAMLPKPMTAAAPKAMSVFLTCFSLFCRAIYVVFTFATSMEHPKLTLIPWIWDPVANREATKKNILRTRNK